MYCKIVNEETRELQVYFGDDPKFAEEYGFNLNLEVEQSFVSGRWFEKGCVPDEEKAADIRYQRDQIIQSLSWRVERYNEQKQLGEDTTDTAKDYNSIIKYRQYLRDITKDDSFPNVEIKSFEEFSKLEEDTEDFYKMTQEL